MGLDRFAVRRLERLDVGGLRVMSEKKRVGFMREANGTRMGADCAVPSLIDNLDWLGHANEHGFFIGVVGRCLYGG